MTSEKAPQVNEVPEAEAKAEGQKLEWGLDLGQLSWHDAMAMIARLNEGLSEGEKSWRLPTVRELLEEYRKTNSTPEGFQSSHYWSCETNEHQPQLAYVVNMSKGYCNTSYYKDNSDDRVRLVRDIA